MVIVEVLNYVKASAPSNADIYHHEKNITVFSPCERKDLFTDFHPEKKKRL